MQNQWQSLLKELSAPLQSTPVAKQSHYLVCLTGLEYLKITGPDRLTFLQGQMTCDFDSIEKSLLLGANCNLKGRACATFFALEFDQATYLIMPNGQAAYLKELLDKYAMFANAELILPSADTLVVGFIGDTASSPSAESMTHINNTNLSLGIASPASIKSWLTAQQDQYLITDQCAWDQQLLAAGISHVTPETREMFIPQELNYDLIDGISFKKGCYKGQEIIARLHYRGTYKQRTSRFQFNGDTLPTPGTPLYTSASEQPCGKVIQSVYASNNKPDSNQTNNIELLAVIKVKASEPLHLEQKDGPILHSLPLPYAITNTDGDN